MYSAQSHSDGRRALGIRPPALPGPSFPEIHVEDEPYDHYVSNIRASDRVDPSPKHKTVAAFHGLSLSIPVDDDEPIAPLASPSSSPRLSRFRRATHARTSPDHISPSTAGLIETRKLLAHLLDKLDTRLRPPDLLARAAATARAAADNGSADAKTSRLGSAVAKLQSPTALKSPASGVSSADIQEEEDAHAGEWDAKETTQLLVQLRDLLLLAEKQHLDLFSRSSEAVTSTHTVDTSVKTKRRGGRLSSFVSPISPSHGSTGRGRITAAPVPRSATSTDTREHLSGIIRDILGSDTAYRVRRHRLLSPPLMLYSTALDIASILYETSELESQSDMLQSVIDSLYCVPPVAVAKVCAWLESRLVGLSEAESSPDLAGGAPRSPLGFDDFVDPFASPPSSSALSPSVPRLSLTPDVPSSRSVKPRIAPPSTATSVPDLRGTKQWSIQRQRMTSLISRTLTAVLSTVDICTAPLDTVFSLHRLTSRFIHINPDISANLLEVLACGPSLARRQAASLLCTYFPYAVGHNTISRRLPEMTYKAQRLRIETGQQQVLGEDLEEDHHYVPWRYFGVPDSVASAGQTCIACNAHLSGFALRCTLCSSGRHWSCGDPKRREGIMTIPAPDSSDHTPSIDVHFSLCLQQPTEISQQGTMKRTGSHAHHAHQQIGDHDLRLVNLFQLIACGVCELPLWGSTSQGYACFGDCRSFYHRSCLPALEQHARHPCMSAAVKATRALTIPTHAIDAIEITKHLDLHIRPFCLDEEAILKLSFDEVSIVHQYLWTQHNIIENGRKSGSVSQNILSQLAGVNLKGRLDEYERHLAPRARISPGAADYADAVGGAIDGVNGYLSDVRFLAYVIALCRTSDVPESTIPAPVDLLTVDWAAKRTAMLPGGVMSTSSRLSIATIRQCLEQDFSINDTGLADIAIKQCEDHGLLRRVSPGAVIKGYHDQDELVIDVPDIVDSSACIDTLLSAVEALLTELDLALNEQGCRILMTRAWPSPLASPAALQRLQLCVLAWICDEESILKDVHLQFASRHQRLPGVRLRNRSPNAGSGSTQTYKQARQRLFERYIRPWLRALHDLDVESYAQTLYGFCASYSNDSAARAAPAIVVEKTLPILWTMIKEHITFGCTLDLLATWLDQVLSLGLDECYTFDHLATLVADHEKSNPGNDNLWVIMQDLAQGDEADLLRVTGWAGVLSASSTEIPWELVDILVTKAVAFCVSTQADSASTMSILSNLAVVVSCNPTPCDAVHAAKIATSLLSTVLSIATRWEQEASHHVLCRLFRLLIHVFDVKPTGIDQTSFHSEPVPSIVISARLRTLPIDPELLRQCGDLLTSGVETVQMTLDFMWMMLTHAKALSDVQRTAYTLSGALYAKLWPLMDLHIDRQCRSRLLLRCVAVHHHPLVDLVKLELNDDHRRSIALERLLRMLLEMADESVVAGPSQWRAPMSDIILLFFESSLDTDNIDSYCDLQTLLSPSHRAAISKCFEERLQRGSDEERLSMLQKLVRIHQAMPDWLLVSWLVLDDLFVEMSAGVSQLASGKSAQHRSAHADALAVLHHLVSLACNMLAHGNSIPYILSQRLQQHIAAACALPWPTAEPYGTILSVVLPSLRRLLDSTAILPEKATSNHVLASIGTGEQAPDATAVKVKRRKLVGSLVVPLVVSFASLLDMEGSKGKTVILDLLLVMYYKHDCVPVELQAVQALVSVARFVERSDSTSDVKVALAVIQSALHTLDRRSLARVTGLIWITLAGRLVQKTPASGHAGDIEPACKVILARLIKEYARIGLFVSVFSHDGDMDTKSHEAVSRPATALACLREDPIHEAIAREAETLVFTQISSVVRLEPAELQRALESLSRFAAASERSMTAEAVLGLGDFLSRLGKTIAEWSEEAFDPQHVLAASASVSQRCPKDVTAPLLSQIATLLHLCLVRFPVHRAQLEAMLSAAARAAKDAGIIDVLDTVVRDMVMAALRGERVHPDSLVALLEFLLANVTGTNEHQSPTRRRAPRPVDPLAADIGTGACQMLLRRHAVIASCTKPSTRQTILELAAEFLLRLEQSHPSSLAGAMLSVGFEAEAASNQISALIYLLSSSMRDAAGSKSSSEATWHQSYSLISTCLPIGSRAASLAFRALADTLTINDARLTSLAIVDGVIVFVRLAALLHGSARAVESGDEAVYEVFWGRVLPEWARLIERSVDGQVVNTELRRTVHQDYIDFVVHMAGVDPYLVDQYASTFERCLHRLRPFVAESRLSGDVVLEQPTQGAYAVARDALFGYRGGSSTGMIDWARAKREMSNEISTFETTRARQ